MENPIGDAVKHEIEHRQLKRDIKKALDRTEELRAEVQKIEQYYPVKRKEGKA